MSAKIKTLIAAAILAAALAAGGCKTPTTDNHPADHTINNGGHYHKPGLTNPTVNCVMCHGADLRGGSGPSCTSCHGQKW